MAFEPPPAPRHRPRSVRDTLLTVGVCCLLLAAFFGDSVRRAGEEMQPGWERTLVLAAGHPAGWLTDTLGLARAGDTLVGWASPDDSLSAAGGGASDSDVTAVASGQIAPVTPDAFDPVELGARPSPPRALDKVLVTGDSMAMPLDAQLARALAGTGAIDTVRDPRLGTGISQTDLLDWRRLAAQQVSKEEPDAVVVFLGANEGFPIGKAQCCGPDWAAGYGTRVRRMMDTYRQNGQARVYWLLLPGPRDAARIRIARAVNLAIRAAAAPYRAQVRVLDMAGLFTPGYHYRDAMDVGGRDQLVRKSDGVHLNDTGARLAAGQVLAAMRRDYGETVPVR
jgi:hypothetical protein